MNRAQIKEIFLEHGFTVKKGQSDLKEYVYQAAEALLQKATGYQQVGYMRWQNGSAEYVSVKRLETPLDSEWHVVFIAAEQPAAQQSPGAWAIYSDDGTAIRMCSKDKATAQEAADKFGLPLVPLYTAPQPTENLKCKSTQKRLATLWGYEKARQPLTDDEIYFATNHIDRNERGWAIKFARAIEAAPASQESKNVDACHRFAAHTIFTNQNTDDTALLRQALEALEHAEKDVADFQRLNTDQTGAVIAALRERLGEQQ